MRQNLEVVYGDTLSFGVELTFETGEPKEPTSMYFSVSENYDSHPFLTVGFGNGITLAKKEGNKLYYRVRVDQNDTSSFSQYKRYKYDLQVNISGDIYTIMRGNLIVDPQVTEKRL